ncbi:hypothetical protein D3C81_1548680 [compost metagenome]
MRLARQNGERLFTVLGHQYVIALTCQVITQDHPDCRFILDHQNHILCIFTHDNNALKFLQLAI